MSPEVLEHMDHIKSNSTAACTAKRLETCLRAYTTHTWQLVNPHFHPLACIFRQIATLSISQAMVSLVQVRVSVAPLFPGGRITSARIISIYSAKSLLLLLFSPPHTEYSLVEPIMPADEHRSYN